MDKQKIWFLYYNNQQYGPFSVLELKDTLKKRTDKDNIYIFKYGWADWKSYSDCHDRDFASLNDDTIVEKEKNEHNCAERVSLSAKIIIRDNAKLTIGSSVNVSQSGIFVKTKKQIFQIGETVYMTVKTNSKIKAFHAKAKVIRFNKDPRFPLGFGLEFIDLNPEIAEKITQIVSEEKDELKIAS